MSARATTNLATLATRSSVQLGASRSITRARASAYAHAVNLRGYEVPDMTQVAPEGPTSGHAYWEAFTRCAGELRSAHVVATIHSPVFRYSGRREYESVYSTVAVLPSEAAANLFIEVLASGRARTCITHNYDQWRLHVAARNAHAAVRNAHAAVRNAHAAVRNAHAAVRNANAAVRNPIHFSQITITPLPAPAPTSYRGPGPYRATTLRLTIQATYTNRRGRRVRFPLYTEGFAFAYGRSVIELTAESIFRPFAQTNEQYLMGILVGRAESQAESSP